MLARFALAASALTLLFLRRVDIKLPTIRPLPTVSMRGTASRATRK